MFIFLSGFYFVWFCFKAGEGRSGEKGDKDFGKMSLICIKKIRKIKTTTLWEIIAKGVT